MKKLIALAAILLTSTSFALSEADSWSEIRAAVKANHKLSISGDYAFVGQIVSAFDVCTDGESFTTTKKLPVYKRQWVGRSRDNNDSERDGYANVIVGYEYKSYPLNTTQRQRQCDNHDRRCTYVDVPFNQSTEKMISVKKHVRTVGSQDRKVYKTLFKKLYVVPACN
jgi:hypothetical protein